MATQLSDLMLNDRGFVFDPANGETYQLSTTGLRVVRLLQHGDAEPAVLAQMIAEFEVDENTARRDLETFLHALDQIGWKS